MWSADDGDGTPNFRHSKLTATVVQKSNRSLVFFCVTQSFMRRYSTISLRLGFFTSIRHGLAGKPISIQAPFPALSLPNSALRNMPNSSNQRDLIVGTVQISPHKTFLRSSPLLLEPNLQQEIGLLTYHRNVTRKYAGSLHYHPRLWWWDGFPPEICVYQVRCTASCLGNAGARSSSTNCSLLY